MHLGRLVGPAGFSRTVAIKRLHSNYAKDPEFVAMFMDEARLAARIQHPNVVSIIDVVAEQGELLLVMDYVQGESLSRLLRAERQKGTPADPRIAAKIMSDVLGGLHSAHGARDERGSPLGIVHRDVSPQNILVGVDGVSHLIDFGVAKAVGRVQSTRDGQIKGKIAYMSPEQIRGATLDARTDVFSASAVLWEVLAGRRLFVGDEATIMYAVLSSQIVSPRTVNSKLDPALDDIVTKGLEKEAENRFASALEMADALESVVTPASNREVARWLEGLAAGTLRDRANLVAEVESMSYVSTRPPPTLANSFAGSAPDAETVTDAGAMLSNISAGNMPQPSAPSDIASTAGVEPSTDTNSSLNPPLFTSQRRSSPWRAIGIGMVVVLLIAGTWILARQSATSPPVVAADPSASLPPVQRESASAEPESPPASAVPAVSLSAPSAAASKPSATATPVPEPSVAKTSGTRTSGTRTSAPKPSVPPKATSTKPSNTGEIHYTRD